MAKKINQSSMDELMGALITPSNLHEESAPSTSSSSSVEDDASDGVTQPRRGRPKKEKERICTSVNMVTMEKLRAISDKEHISLTDLITLALDRLVGSYELKHGPIKAKAKKKGDIEKVFNL